MYRRFPVLTAVTSPVAVSPTFPITGYPSGAAAIVDAYAVAGFSPPLVFDFAEDYYRTGGSATTFDLSQTHSRNSNATMVDSDGLLKWAPHNELTYSEQFDSAGWTNNNTSVTANVTTAPDGTNSAYELIENNTTNIHFLSVQTSYTAGITYTHSIYAKANTRSVLQIVLSSLAFVSDYANFDLSSGTVSASSTLISAEIESVGNGWYHCSVTETASSSSSASNTLLAYVIQDNPTASRAASYTGDGTSGIYIWGAHLYRSDLGGMVDNPDRGDSYVPTTTSARYLPRRGHHVYNGSAWVNEGLLVESEPRTNVAYYSNDISETTTGWTAGATLISPATGITGIDGVSGSPFKLITGSSGNIQYVGNNNTVTAGQDYAICAILKDAGDGVYASFYGLGIGAADQVPVFDLVNGTVDVAATTTVVKEAGIYPWGSDGWYFCWARVTAGGTAGVALGVNNSATDNNNAGYIWTGDDTSGYYVAYVGCEQTSGMPSIAPIPTSGSTVTRAADSLTVPSANLPWPTPEVIGEELVTNGTFEGTSKEDWDDAISLTGNPLSNNVTVGSGVITTNNVSQYFGQYISVTNGSVYTISYEVVSNSGGAINLSSGSPFGGYVGPTTVGTHTVNLKCVDDTRPLLFFVSDNGAQLDNISVKEINPLAVSIQMDGAMTGDPLELVRWYDDADNNILLDADTSTFVFTQEDAGTVDSVTGGSFTSGTNVPFNIASRHGSTFINGAVDGTALTANTTPTALPDLSTTDLNLAYDFMGTIKTFRVWDVDLGDAGIATASITPPAIYGVPTISGEINDPEVGETLAAVSATLITGTPTPSTTWQWLRDGVAISGATSSSYTLVSADLGTKISVKQTETNGGGEATGTSAETATVTGIPATATQQRDGSYILDRAGNYIEVRA